MVQTNSDERAYDECHCDSYVSLTAIEFDKKKKMSLLGHTETVVCKSMVKCNTILSAYTIYTHLE